jgi:hypothetical protein
MGLVADPNASNVRGLVVSRSNKEKLVTIATTVEPNHDRFCYFKIVLRSENIDIKTIFTFWRVSLVEEVLEDEIQRPNS